MRALDVEAHLRDLQGDLEGVRAIIADGEANAGAGRPDAKVRAQALLALISILETPIQD